MSKEALLIFTKNPEAGKVKTRLAATLGDEAALSIYRQLLLHTVSATEYLPVDKFVFYSNHIGQKDYWSDKNYYKLLQEGNDLGERMKNAFVAAFQKGYHKVVIIGTDCPDLNAPVIMNAYVYLEDHDIVIGPAIDGGYYLLGMKKLHPRLFEKIDWSTGKVLAQTLKICESSNLSTFLLPELSDIDDENDLKKYMNRSLAVNED
jgi:rSAM/selenodomain-associated transferase 1